MELTVKDIIKVTSHIDNIFINGVCASLCEYNMNIIVDDYEVRMNKSNEKNLFITSKQF